MRKTITDASTLLDALESLFPDSSRTTLRQMLQQERIRINGTLEKNARRQLAPEDVIQVASRQARSHLDPRIALLYEDDDLLVVEKSSGLLTVASPGEKEETVQALLNAYLASRGLRVLVHVVHRLDRDSSGVLVFAKNFRTREALKERFAEHDIERVYVAIIRGRMEPPSGTFRSYLAEDKSLKVRTVANAMRGKLAVTHYKTLESGKRYSMLEVRLETGRRNQIRVHLAEAGHPIVGDTMYGKGENPIGRLGLHARHLAFVHPVSARKLAFDSPIPEEFRKVKL